MAMPIPMMIQVRLTLPHKKAPHHIILNLKICPPLQNPENKKTILYFKR